MILDRIYSPASFFGRVRRVGAALQIPARTPAASLRLALREFGRFLRLMFGITIGKGPKCCRPRCCPFPLRFVINRIDEQIRRLTTAFGMPALVAPPNGAHSMSEIAANQPAILIALALTNFG